jgi:hypothetical protein
MGTQGLITLVDSAGEVVAKLVAGCQADGAHALADTLVRLWPQDLHELRSTALGMGFGSADCLVVLGPEGEVGATQELPARYRRTFQQYRFNPRWEAGVAEYTAVRIVGVHPHLRRPLDALDWAIVRRLLDLGNRYAISRLLTRWEAFWLHAMGSGLIGPNAGWLRLLARSLEYAEAAMPRSALLTLDRPAEVTDQLVDLVDALRAWRAGVAAPTAKEWAGYYMTKLRTLALEMED